MRVLIVNHTPIHGSGSGTYCKQIARGLARAGHEPVVLTLGSTNARRVDDVTWVQRRISDDGRFPSFTGHPDCHLTYADLTAQEIAEYRAGVLNALRTLVEEEGVELVHAQHLWFIAAEAARLSLPMVVTSHGSEFGLLQDEANPRWTDVRRSAEQLSAGAVFVSSAVRSAAESSLRVSLGDCRVIGNGFDAEVFCARGGLPHAEPGAAQAIAVMGGRMVAYKRHDLALAALDRASASGPAEISVEIVGDGPLRARLEEAATRLDLRCRFHGFVDQRDLASLLACARLFVSPAIDEPFGLLSLEAVAVGCPAVVSRRSGVASAIGSEAGTIVDGDEVDEWARAIATELATRRSREGVARSVQAHTWDAVVAQLVESYEGRVSASRDAAATPSRST